MTRNEEMLQPDELVDIKLERRSDGLELDFTSHGRRHKLMLQESKQNLSEISLNFLGMSESETEKVKNRVKHVKLVKDVKHGAAVAVEYGERDEVEPILQGGVFRLGAHEFHIKPHKVSKNKVMVSKRAIRERANYGNDGVKVDLQRKRRQVEEIAPISAEVELVMLADYSVWKFFELIEIRGEGASDYMTNLLLYLAHMSVIMDAHYNTMQNDDIAISVKLAGIVAITDPTILSNLTEDYSIYLAQLGETYIGASGALSRLSDWLGTDESANILPPHDHVMLLTTYDMYDEDSLSEGILGLAWVGTICDPELSSSFVEMKGLLTYNAFTAAHELGHSLGSSHDSLWGNSESCPDDNYVMAASAGNPDMLTNKFLFSCCSQRSFYGVISDVECLGEMTAMPNYSNDIAESIAQYLPGQIYDADDQCYMIVGTEACYEEYYAERGIEMCLNLYCTLPNQPGQCGSQYIAPADGTKCGENQWCYRGECVPEDTVYQTLDQNCNVRDCYGNETRCDGGVSRTPQLFYCYRESQRCDQIEQCFDGSDELDCPEFSCPEGFTQCLNGMSKYAIEQVPSVCVPDVWICDGEPDCFDESDEGQLCYTTTPNQPTTSLTPMPTSKTIAPTSTIKTSTPKPTTKTSTPKPTTKTTTPKPTTKTTTPKPTTKTSTPEPTIKTSTPEPTIKTSTQKTTTSTPKPTTKTTTLKPTTKTSTPEPTIKTSTQKTTTSTPKPTTKTTTLKPTTKTSTPGPTIKTSTQKTTTSTPKPTTKTTTLKPTKKTSTPKLTTKTSTQKTATSTPKPITENTTLRPTTKTSTLESTTKTSTLKPMATSTPKPTTKILTLKPTTKPTTLKPVMTSKTTIRLSTLLVATSDLSTEISTTTTTTKTEISGLRKLRFDLSMRILGFQSMNFSCEDPDLQVPITETFQSFSELKSLPS
ncbi:uncharacterized protein [Watersipora subatra]|uniref:uncharacterized protein n=1 Tax=Watersipora subatra TaxID=2589382 RepID=UPI00355C3838